VLLRVLSTTYIIKTGKTLLHLKGGMWPPSKITQLATFKRRSRTASHSADKKKGSSSWFVHRNLRRSAAHHVGDRGFGDFGGFFVDR
jgi:hypothetical protein